MIVILQAEVKDADEIAAVHLAARLEAMPWLHRAHTDAATRGWFAGAVGNQRSNWWVARSDSRIVGYMLLDGEHLDHLYVQPGWQRLGIGRQLLEHAKTLSPSRLVLRTFQKNTNARAFYQAHGFQAVSFTPGDNEEHEPDVQYVWEDD